MTDSPFMPVSWSLPNRGADGGDRKSTRLNSSHGYISYAVFCLKKKKNPFTTQVEALGHPSRRPLVPLPAYWLSSRRVSHPTSPPSPSLSLRHPGMRSESSCLRQ